MSASEVSGENAPNAAHNDSLRVSSKQQQEATVEPESTTKEISTREAYFVSLNAWVKNANISQNAMAFFPWYLMSCYPQLFQQQAGVTTTQPTALPPPAANVGGNGEPETFLNSIRFSRLMDNDRQLDIINRTGGYEFVVAPFWKRAFAEIIDICILLLIKIIVTFTVMNVFDLDIGFEVDRQMIDKAIEEEDYIGFLTVVMDILAFSSDLLTLEVLTKIIVCFYEAIWTTMYNGATPGKASMGIRIYYVEAAVQLQRMPRAQFGLSPQREMRALLYPAETPNFKRALMRAFLKNMIITLLFPIMVFIMVFYKDYRTAYEILTKTMVVEINENPVLQRQR